MRNYRNMTDMDMGDMAGMSKIFGTSGAQPGAASSQLMDILGDGMSNMPGMSPAPAKPINDLKGMRSGRTAQPKAFWLPLGGLCQLTRESGGNEEIGLG